MWFTDWRCLVPSLSAREFGISLRKFGVNTIEQADIVARKIIIDLFSAVVLDTPVDTGRAIGNWYPSLNAPSPEVDFTIADRSGQLSLDRIHPIAQAFEFGNSAWLTNNLPYILALENGHSK